MFTKLKTSLVSLPLAMTDNNEDAADVRVNLLALGDEVELMLHLGLLRAGFYLVGQKLLQNSPQGLYFQ